ncbi:hypothetical protein QCA50_017841 [Cerrena zonata]|uniref:ABC transporter domain-containing protein n=1 Tax=Cerrena zonata TaxID=2478898 RepID=A0AAW0FIC1_9APHY
MDDIIEVSKQANCHDFISAFPEGYDTIIGARGASLSGGQKQRVAIARALIKRPSILILDEATSALDSKLESLINETLKNLTSQGRMTIISIAHRLSTISKSENVVVLGKHGKVVEQGRFVELFSNPQSELSKLLDESSSKESKDESLDDEDVEEVKEDDEQRKLDEEALRIEKEQKQQSEMEIVRSMIDDLPYDLRAQLVQQVSKEFEDDKKAAVLEKKLDDNIVS